jgi:hypothetical protein
MGRAVTGGTSLSGISQSGVANGGGYWQSDWTGIWLGSPDSILCLRAWSAELDGGGTQFVLPVFDLGQAPRPSIGLGWALPGSPAPSSDFFAQEPGFGLPLIIASIVGAFPRRATTIKGTISVGRSLKGGERFSIQHPTMGWRMYAIGRVVSVDGGGQTFNIRPPLREALAGGEAMEFDVPRFQATLIAAKADDLEPDIQLNLLATVGGSFQEAF